MAAPTKQATAFTGLGAVAVGTTANSQWVNLSTWFQSAARLAVTWSGSLTAAPTIAIQVSPDNGTTIYTYATLNGPTGASPWTVPPIDLSDCDLYVRASVKNNDATVTITASGHVVSEITVQ